jgi:hypothetical protein
MIDDAKSPASRRSFLRLSAGAVALIPVVNLLGCSDGGSGSAASPEETGGPKPAPAPGAPAEGSTDGATSGAEAPEAPTSGNASGSQGGTTDRVKLEESDPTATALGYRHAAADVDPGRYPRYQDGQACANCNLFQAGVGDDAGWGGCSIFPGKLVNANGWCSAYVAKA